MEGRMKGVRGRKEEVGRTREIMRLEDEKKEKGEKGKGGARKEIGGRERERDGRERGREEGRE